MPHQVMCVDVLSFRGGGETETTGKTRKTRFYVLGFLFRGQKRHLGDPGKVATWRSFSVEIFPEESTPVR